MGMEHVGWLAVIATVFYIGCRFAGWYSRTERIRALLHCTKKQAIVVKHTLEAKGVEWMTLFSWVNVAMNRYMPLFVDPASTQLIAVWDETRHAMFALILKKVIDPSWSDEVATAEIGKEILRQRGAENPLVGKNQKNIIDAMTF